MGWLDNLLLKRVVGSITRRVLDLTAGFLVAYYCYGSDACRLVGEFVLEHMDKIEALVVAVVLSLGSLFWSFAQKRRDVKSIRDGQIVVRR